MKISIIIPTFNEEKVISKTIEAFNQLPIPHEIIVTDDGSTDETVNIARRHGVKVLVPTNERPHTTIAANRNAGGKAATGDFLVFIDAGVSIPGRDDFFARALANFDRDPNLLALTGYIRIVPEKETFGDKFFFGFLNANIRFLNNVVKRGEAVGKFQMMRRDAFQRVGGFREDLVTREDGDIFMRIARIGRTKCDPSLIVFHEGRRAHAVGWIKLLFIWSMNTIWVLLFDKAFSKEWKPVR